MSMFLFASALLVAAAAANPPAAKGKAVWEVDPMHSEVGFSVRHLGISKIGGVFKSYNAVMEADPTTAKLTALEATVQTASIDTGIAQRDDHLRSDEFFGAANYPVMRAKLQTIRWQGNRFTARVDLTIRDVTKTIAVTGELLGVHKVNFGQGDQLRAGYEATATINRQEFGLKFNKLAEGVAMVGNEVTIHINVEMWRAL
jgi:polyisoprenoid-binding protein YceI